MVAYSFRPRFVDPIVAGLEPGPLLPGMKRQTVRAPRVRHARPGEVVQLYTGMRTRSCKHLGNALCIAVEPIVLSFEGRGSLSFVNDRMTCDLNDFAMSDGFRDWADLTAFWAAEHDGISRFEGMLIRWKTLLAGEVRP